MQIRYKKSTLRNRRKFSSSHTEDYSPGRKCFGKNTVLYLDRSKNVRQTWQGYIPSRFQQRRGQQVSMTLMSGKGTLEGLGLGRTTSMGVIGRAAISSEWTFL